MRESAAQAAEHPAETTPAAVKRGNEEPGRAALAKGRAGRLFYEGDRVLARISGWPTWYAGTVERRDHPVDCKRRRLSAGSPGKQAPPDDHVLGTDGIWHTKLRVNFDDGDITVMPISALKHEEEGRFEWLDKGKLAARRGSSASEEQESPCQQDEMPAAAQSAYSAREGTTLEAS